MKRTVKDVTELIGNTPLVRLNRLPAPGSAEIYAKLEALNPGGSVKDRIAFNMIEQAEKRGQLKPGSRIVEATSGNTGIGLAMVGASRGYTVTLVMPDNMSYERIQILKAYGAEVILTPVDKGMAGAVDKAREIVSNAANCFMPSQFTNADNPAMHRKTTAKEILNDLDGKFDAFVAGVGTGGTITGVAEVLKKHDPAIRIYGVEPASSPVLSGGKPGAHMIQGIGAGFVPAVLKRDLIDKIYTVSDDNAYQTASQLSKKEGILAGISAGAAAFVALQVAKELGKGKTVVVVFPDSGERYLSVVQYFEG